jgi:dUTP pyrophosphatase
VLIVKLRGFEVVSDKFREFPKAVITLPKRKTTSSAGYDLAVVKGDMILPGETVHFATDVKVYMQPDELFIINVRSSIGFNKKLRLVNTQGWIDADFYSNVDNDGNIGIGLFNPTSRPVVIADGERVAQGIFVNYLVKDNDEQDIKSKRIGGIGSTGRK